MSLAALILSAACGLAAPTLRAEKSQFVLDTGNATLRSPDLIGAVFEVADDTGTLRRLRLQALTPSAENPAILLHDFRVESTPGQWTPLCNADAHGRKLGLPIAGGWDAAGRFVADPDKLFVSCTLGSQAKCILSGYDPWATGPGGENLIPYYEACQQMIRAAYGGSAAHTTDGTTIDIYDDLGIQSPATLADPGFAFEAGWTPQGAVCLDHSRHPEVISRDAVLALYPRLAVPACTEATARAAGAMLFTRSRPVPTDGF
jgi:hypothetical protein